MAHEARSRAVTPRPQWGCGGWLTPRGGWLTHCGLTLLVGDRFRLVSITTRKQEQEQGQEWERRKKTTQNINQHRQHPPAPLPRPPALDASISDSPPPGTMSARAAFRRSLFIGSWNRLNQRMWKMLDDSGWIWDLFYLDFPKLSTAEVGAGADPFTDSRIRPRPSRPEPQSVGMVDSPRILKSNGSNGWSMMKY